MVSYMCVILTFSVFLYLLLSDHGSGHTCSDNICEHNCTDLTEGGFLCSCRPGYKPRTTEKHTCEGKQHISRPVMYSVHLNTDTEVLF